VGIANSVQIFQTTSHPTELEAFLKLINTEICFKEVGHDDVDWNYQAVVRDQQQAVVYMVIYLQAV
jgi:hypothetical protein